MVNNKHRRRSIRLRGYDYSQPGAYFVTIVTHDRECLFGEIVEGQMRLSPYGRIATEEWARTADVRTNVVLDTFAVMPNHIHGIIIITGRGTAAPCPYEPAFGKSIPHALPTIIGQIKSITTKRINIIRDTPGLPVWQRNYYEHVIRNDHELDRIREYIANNPMQWAMDLENPMAVRPAPGNATDDIETILQVGQP